MSDLKEREAGAIGDLSKDQVDNTIASMEKQFDKGSSGGGFAPSLATGDDDAELSEGARKILGLSKKNRSRLFFAVGGGGLVGAMMGFFTFFAQPLQVVHFAETIKGFHFEHLEDISNFKRFRRLKFLGDPDAVIKRRAGFAGSFVVNQMDKQWASNGVKVNRNPQGRLVSFTVDNLDTVAAFKEAGYKVEAGETILAEDSMFANKKNRTLTRKLAFQTGNNAPSSAILARLTIKLHGLNFRIFGNIRNSIDDFGRVRLNNIKESGREWRANKFEPRIDSQAKGSFDRVRGTDLDDLKEGDSDAELKNKLSKKLGAGIGVVSLVTTACVVKQLAGLAVVQDIKSKFNSSIAYAQAILVAASQFQVGNFVLAQLEELARSFFSFPLLTDAGDGSNSNIALNNTSNPFTTAAAPGISTDDDGKSSWAEALAVRTSTGSNVNGLPIQEEYTIGATSNAVDDSFQTLDDKTGGWVSRTCKAALNKVVGFFLTVAEVGIAIGTGSLSAVITELVQEGVFAVFGDEIAEKFVDSLRGITIPNNVAGAQLGGVVFQGGVFLSNTISATSAGEEITKEEDREQKNATRIGVIEEFQSRDRYSRYFDTTNSNSFASNVIANIPLDTFIEPSREAVSGTFASTVTSILKSPFKVFSSGGKAKALGGDIYDVGTPVISEPPSKLENPKFYPVDKHITEPIRVYLEEKITPIIDASISAQCAIIQLRNPLDTCRTSPFLNAQSALEVINNNTDPTPYGLEKTGDYRKSISATCFNRVGYDYEDHYAGDTFWVGLDKTDYIALKVEGRSSEELGARPDWCNNGIGAPEVELKTDKDYTSGEPYNIHTVKFKFDEELWDYHQQYFGVTAHGSADACFYALLPGKDEKVNQKAEDICTEEYDLGETVVPTDKQIDLFKITWEKTDIEIDVAKIRDESFELGESGAIVGDTSDIPCSAGSDQGASIGSAGGQNINIRTCGFGNGIEVNSTISESVAKLIEAAKKDGVTLAATSSYRSTEQQAYLYNCYITNSCNIGATGNANLAARPGTSDHEAGLAIDFTRPSIQWLENNMDIVRGLGFSADVPGEDWHFAANK